MRIRRASTLCSLLLSACAVQPVDLGRPVRFDGAVALGPQSLRTVIAGVLDGGALDREGIAAATQALRRAYHALGFADATVDASEQPDGTVAFTFQEGRRWTLRALDVDGNAALTDATLLGLWRVLPVPRGQSVQAPPFAPGDPFDPTRVETFANLVLQRYVDAGWLDARLGPPTLERDEQAGTVALTLQIAHEGPRYRIRAFVVPDAVRALLGEDMPRSPAGEICTRAAVEGFAAGIVAALRRRGHPEPELRVGAERDAGAGEITLELTVDSGPARTVAEVAVEGNRRVPSALVRDKLGFAPGDRFDGDVERRGIAALSATGEFSRLDVRYEALDDERMRLVVEAEETTGLVLRGAPYYHPWRRLGYNLFVEGRDALGERHDVLGHVHLGHRGYHFGGRYVHSGIFDEATSLTVGGDFFYNERPAFTDRGAGGAVELRRYVSPHLTIAAGYAFLAHFDTTFDAAATTNVGRDYSEGRASLAIELDDTDNRLLPTRGHRASVKVERVDEALGADVEFTRLRLGAGVWLPLGERVRISLEANTGLLWPGEDSAGIPVPERFFLGGYDSVRSFREDRLGPRDATGALRGGEFSNLARSELVVRVLEPLDVALFADAGNLGTDVSGWDLDGMRYAVGLSLRLMSQESGPLVLNAAWNPDRERGEDEWVVDFAAGVIF